MKILNKETFSYVQYLSQQNIDVFNLSSDFYIDLCYYFDSPIKKDVALKDRIKLFFPNITLCENGCQIKGINATSMKAECVCKLNNLINNNIFSDLAWYQNQVVEIGELLSQINIEILKCGSNIFKYKTINSYDGFFIILSLIILQIILSVIYFILGINPIKKYIFIILDSFQNYLINRDNAPPKKKKSLQKLEKNTINEKAIKIESSNVTENSKENKENDINKNNLPRNNSVQILNLINNNNSNEIMVFSPLKKETNRNLTFYENKSNINYGFDFKEYLETDIDDLIFEEIIERDKRTFCEYFKEQLKSNLMVIDAIYNNEPLKPRVIKLTLYIINIDLYFIMNALFINEEFISDVFSSEKNDIIEIIKRSFDRYFIPL